MPASGTMCPTNLTFGITNEHFPGAEEIRRFIGFAGYYRRFIKNFSQIAKALTDMMPSPQKKSNRKRKHIQKPWNWGDDQEKAQTQCVLHTLPLA
jgi:hypothetical protein